MTTEPVNGEGNPASSPEDHVETGRVAHNQPSASSPVQPGAVGDGDDSSTEWGALGEDPELSATFASGQPFTDGAAAKLLGRLSPHLKVLGHHYDDVVRVIRYALTGKAEVLYASVLSNAALNSQVEASTGLHIHTGRPFAEVGVVLAVALATAYLVDGPGKSLPYPVRVILKAAGVLPLFGHLIRGELVHALDELKKGEFDDAVHQLLITGLVLLGVLKRKGADEVAAGTVMSAILAAIGRVQTDAAERSVLAVQRTVDALPHSARAVQGDQVVEVNVDALTPRSTHIELRSGETLPVNVIITALPPGRSSVLVDSSHSRGQMAQHYIVGDHLDQGSVILEAGVTIRGCVDATFEESAIVSQVRNQENFEPSRRQSIAETVGHYWVWGTLAGTLLVATYHLLRPLLKGERVRLDRILEHATAFATLSAPCNILVSTMIEGATRRGLMEEGLITLRGDAISKMDKIRTYCFDFTGTCSMGAEFVEMAFFDRAGNPVPPDVAEELFAEATVVGMSARSQHLKQKAMRRALFEKRSPEEAQELSEAVSDATETQGKGVSGLVRGHRVRVGKENFVFGEETPSAGQVAALEAKTKSTEHSPTHIRVGNCVGVVLTRDRLRPGAKEAIQKLGADRVYILTGDNNREFILRHTRALGIPDDHVHTNLSPQEKADQVDALKDGKGLVAMVGDGWNDGAPMRRADVRFAMRDNVDDRILETVDFLTPNLASVAPLRDLSSKVNAVSATTLVFSVLYTGLTALAQGAGIMKLPVITAAFAHEGVSGISVLVHDLLSRRFLSGFAKQRDLLLALAA